EALLIGDAGWNTWEEIDLCSGGENFGWPCFEGPGPLPVFQALDTRGFCAGLTPTAPLLTWNHDEPGSAAFTGNCASGLCVYRGSRYPAVHRPPLLFLHF